MKKLMLATVWKPTKANGGSAETIRLDQIDTKCAATVCARYYKGISSNGVNCVVERQDCVLIDSYNNKIKSDGNCGTLTGAGYLGIRNCGTFLLVDGFNLDSDGVSCRGLKAQYQKNSASNFVRQGSYGATAVIVVDEQNRRCREDIVGTLTTDGSSPKHNNRVAELGGDYLWRIRKLIPKETWSLQGFDGKQFEKAKAAGVSDSQLYRQSGNAISQNISEILGLTIAFVEAIERMEKQNEKSNSASN